ncbi:MAG: ribosome recycling factor [Coriobacteriales bacterium]|nr:ribosome recycling factor [Actinomycetes bacterium]
MTITTIAEANDHMDKALASLAHEFSSVRTGRASSTLLEKLTVEYYGAPTPLLQIASVSVPEPQLLVITPYDRTAIKAIEKAILSSDLGLNPANDGQVIRLPFPPLTEERRRELVRLCRHYAEEARVAVRNIRRDLNEHLKHLQKAGEISEDELHRQENEVQKATDEHIRAIDEMVKRKEEEIMEV